MKIYLDLLPRQRKLELKRKRIFRKILGDEFLFLLPVISFVLILLGVYYMLSIQRKTAQAVNTSAQSQEKYQQLNMYEQKFKEVNENTAALLKIQTGHLYWSNIFEKMSSVVPEGILINDFSTKNYKIFLIGKAKNRDILLDFKSKLEADKCFADINVPLSNLVVRDDVDFQMDFSINKDCLKKQ